MECIVKKRERISAKLCKNFVNTVQKLQIRWTKTNNKTKNFIIKKDRKELQIKPIKV
jgi:hypothetical protein